MKPLAVDLYGGLGGWASGCLAEGYDVIGFDVERHEYGEHRYPATLVIQDVLTLHGSQFKDAALIVASPPCQAYSYRAMPWKRAKALPPPDNTLFEACFRIQREACETAGRHIPMVVENVRGAQPWVGRARWNFGKLYLWGDVPALMPMTRSLKNNGGSWFAIGGPGQKITGQNPDGRNPEAIPSEGRKTVGMNWSDQTKRGQDFTRIAGQQALYTNGDETTGRKNSGGSWFAVAPNTISGLSKNARDMAAEGIKQGGTWTSSSKSPARKAASALIAKIPLPLSRHIAATFRP